MNRKNLQHLTLPYSKLTLDVLDFFDEKSTKNFDSTTEIYTKSLISNTKLSKSSAGFSPFLRGINTFASKENIKIDFSDTKNIFFSFNLSTNLGVEITESDSNSKYHLQTLNDMKILLKGISLQKTAIHFKITQNILPVLAFFIAAAQDLGISINQLSGSIKNEVSEELLNSSYLYSPKKMIQIWTSILEFTSIEMPSFNPINISSHLWINTKNNVVETLAFQLILGFYFFENGLKNKISETALANTSFFFTTSDDFFLEIAKIRASRVIWNNLAKSLNTKNETIFAQKINTQAYDDNFDSENILNHLGKINTATIASFLSGTQNLQTTSTKFEKNAIFNTLNEFIPFILQDENLILKTVDAFGGSYYLESLTLDLIKKTQILIEQFKNTNKIELDFEMDILKNLNKKTEFHQKKYINNNYALNELKIASKTQKGNLLAFAIEAAKSGASLFEISHAII